MAQQLTRMMKIKSYLNWVVVVVLVLGGAICPVVHGHEMRPAYLEITEIQPELYDVYWKVPAKVVGGRLSLDLVFDDQVKVEGEPAGMFIDGAHVERTRVICPGGLPGTTVTIEGLSSTMTDVLLRFKDLEGVENTHRLTPENPSYEIKETPGTWDVAWTYLVLGVEHILLGIDHLLFVLALLILVDGKRKLLATITAFTLSHSITLALATLGFVNMPGPPVEAVIALSIVFVAAEIIRGYQGNPGLSQRWPWSVAFVFGLLHGFGFAGALSDVGLPQQSIPMALFTFNVGVEVGQLIFVAIVLVVMWVASWCGRKFHVSAPSWAWRVPPYAIGAVAAFWMIERTVGFWSMG